MIRIAHRTQALGQFNPAAPYYGTTTGQLPLDPLVQVGLQAAGQILAQNDPGAPQTVQLIERIIVAPPLFPSSGGPSGPSISKVSDVNPYLSVIANFREHPLLVLGGIIAVPVIAYMLGKRAGERS